MTFDPRLQVQQTTLASTRTGIAAGVLAGLLVRQAVRTAPGRDAVSAAASVLGAVAILAVGSRDSGLRHIRRP